MTKLQELLVYSHNLTAGGQDAELGPVLARYGMTAERIEETRQQALACREASDLAHVLLSRQKQHTEEKQAKLKLVQKELSDLSFLIRLLYPNATWRSMLSMQTRYGHGDTQADTQMEDEEIGEDGSPDGAEAPEGPRAVRPGRNEAKLRMTLPRAVSNLAAMPEEARTQLAQHGWGDERLEELNSLLQSYLNACDVSTVSKQRYQQHLTDTRKIRLKLERCYRAFSLQIRRNLHKHPGLEKHLAAIAKSL